MQKIPSRGVAARDRRGLGAVLPTPASPRTTSARACPPRTASTSPSSSWHPRWRPTRAVVED